MVDATVSFALEKFGNFLIQEIGLPQRLRKDVVWLKSELEYMQSFLEDAGDEHQRDHRVDTLVSEVRDIANEAVYILEKFTTSSAGNSRRSSCGLTDCIRMYSCICSKEANLRDSIEKIESVKERLEQIPRKRETYGIGNTNDAGEGPSNDLNSHSMIMRLRRATSYVDDELFIGFEDVFKTLLYVLLKSETRRSIVSIYGMGGLGKTTLARQLYQAVDVKENFLYRAWVCVSQEYNIQDLLRTVIKSFKKGCSPEELDSIEKKNEQDLERYLRDFLKDERYLVVIDDVWRKEAWESLKRAFPDSKNGSRIIITTRIKEVAERVDDRTFAKQLRFFSPEESWDLFYKKISRGEGHANWCSASMLDLGKAMVDKCGGLPLAIMVLGGLLLHRKGLEEWRTVKRHIWRHLKNDSIEIKYILSLSYNHLSDELKQCFLYLGVFPEDHLIDTEKLIWLWMAEDLIPLGEEMEDNARDLLQELYNRSMIQVAGCYRGVNVACKIHDLLRDLAVEKATANQVNLFGIYDPRKHSSPHSSTRLAIHSQIDKFFSDGLFNSHLRSLLLFDPDFRYRDTENLTSGCKKFKNLRVLDFHGLFHKEHVLPDAIGDLIHLRFLGLMGTVFFELPPSIGNLQNLQTLEALLDDACHIKFPPEISKLKNLRHLFAKPDALFQFETLTNLRTLRYVKYDQWVKNNFQNLINLRELAIEKIHKPNREAYSLDGVGKLISLEILDLQCSYNETLPGLESLSCCQNLIKLRLEGRIEKLPPPDKFPKSLTVLSLCYSKLKDDPMLVLGKLPNLTNLLLESSYDGKRMTCLANSFCQLEFLYLSGLDYLEKWKLDDGAMPMLKGLQITECPKLKVPGTLKSVPAPRDSMTMTLNATYTFGQRNPVLSIQSYK